MADKNKNENMEPESTEQMNSQPQSGEQEQEEQKQPTIEELTLQLAKANAEAAKYKNSINKLTHENSELNKWKKERMTAQEEFDEAERIAKEAQESRIKELEDYKKITEATNRYMTVNKMPPELARATAEAEISGDMETVHKNTSQHQAEMIEKAVNDAKAEWLKSRPDIQEQSAEKNKEEAERNAFFKAFN